MFKTKYNFSTNGYLCEIHCMLHTNPVLSTLYVIGCLKKKKKSGKCSSALL